MKITTELLEEIKAKAGKAAAGPWRHDGYNLYGDPDRDGWTPIAVAECHKSPTNGQRYKAWERNAAHIARMDPPTTLALVEEIERLREALRPFAEKALDVTAPDFLSVPTLIGHFRRARKALEGK